MVFEHKGQNMLFFPRSYVVVDLETTGLSPEYDEIIEMAAIKVVDGIVIDTFQSLIKPQYDVCEFITQLTGITNEMLVDAPTIDKMLPSFSDFVGDSIILGHNVNFDINFLYVFFSYFLDKPFTNNFVDTMRISRRMLPDLNHHRLIDIVNALEIPESTYHRALSDCELTMKCFEKMYANALEKNSDIDYINSQLKKPLSYINAKDITTDKTEFDKSHPLYKKACVFTGELEKYPRREAMQLVVDFGGICQNSVTKETNYLILGNYDYCKSLKGNKSNKHKKAEEYKLRGYDIEIIPENVFYDMLKG